MAVISNDSDFLMFNGTWRLWSSDVLKFESPNQLTSIEYYRDGITKLYSISQRQLPLFATLLRFSQKTPNFQTTANYIGNKGSKADLTDAEIVEITQHVFGHTGKDKQELIRNSIDSYKLNVPAATNDDPFERVLSKTTMYQPYMMIKNRIQAIPLYFYDMQGTGSNLTSVIMNWTKRKIGVVRSRDTCRDSFAFLLLAKKECNERFGVHKEKPIYPECNMISNCV